MWKINHQQGYLLATSVKIHKTQFWKRITKWLRILEISLLIYILGGKKNNWMSFLNSCLSWMTDEPGSKYWWGYYPTGCYLTFFPCKNLKCKSFVLIAILNLALNYYWNTGAAVVTLWGWTEQTSRLLQVSSVTCALRVAHDSLWTPLGKHTGPRHKALGGDLCSDQQTKYSPCAWGSS